MPLIVLLLYESGVGHGIRQSVEETRGCSTCQGIELITPLALRTAVGSLCESYAHECLKSSFAFRKPAMAVVSRHPARTEGL